MELGGSTRPDEDDIYTLNGTPLLRSPNRLAHFCLNGEVVLIGKLGIRVKFEQRGQVFTRKVDFHCTRSEEKKEVNCCSRPLLLLIRSSPTDFCFVLKAQQPYKQ